MPRVIHEHRHVPQTLSHEPPGRNQARGGLELTAELVKQLDTMLVLFDRLSEVSVLVSEDDMRMNDFLETVCMSCSSWFQDGFCSSFICGCVAETLRDSVPAATGVLHCAPE